MTMTLTLLTLEETTRWPLWLRSRARDDGRGPSARFRGLVSGLAELGVAFRVNPPPRRIRGEVGVVSTLDGLRDCLEAKERGTITTLVAGPNLVVVPTDNHGIVTDARIDRCAVPCGWVRDFYLSVSPELTGRIAIWAAGVDQHYWSPDPSAEKQIDVLVYRKTCSQELHDAVIAELSRRRQRYHVLEYGSYHRPAYRELLRASRSALFLSESESQGIAMFEAWSCDVPTLVWDRRLWHWPRTGHTWTGASSAPYLDDTCGRRFTTAEELPDQLDQFWADLDNYQPRRFVLANHTARHSALDYLRLFAGAPSANPMRVKISANRRA